jgi:hypothetical protein
VRAAETITASGMGISDLRLGEVGAGLSSA